MEKEWFAGKIRGLLICVSKCQPIEVLGEPGTVEIEARVVPSKLIDIPMKNGPIQAGLLA